jgi:uncharacterized protein with GYD domain
MPKFLLTGSYSVDGVKRLIDHGGTKRRQEVERVVEVAGGRLEALYWAFGEDDVYAVIDLPTNASMAAISLAVGAAGLLRSKTVVLMTPEEVDEATRQSGELRPPGT